MCGGGLCRYIEREHEELYAKSGSLRETLIYKGWWVKRIQKADLEALVREV